jgi:hypothetical protein
MPARGELGACTGGTASEGELIVLRAQSVKVTWQNHVAFNHQALHTGRMEPRSWVTSAGPCGRAAMAQRCLFWKMARVCQTLYARCITTRQEPVGSPKSGSTFSSSDSGVQYRSTIKSPQKVLKAKEKSWTEIFSHNVVRPTRFGTLVCPIHLRR